MVIEEFMYRVARRPLSKLIALLPAAEPPPTFDELERNLSRACLPVTLRQNASGRRIRAVLQEPSGLRRFAVEVNATEFLPRYLELARLRGGNFDAAFASQFFVSVSCTLGQLINSVARFFLDCGVPPPHTRFHAGNDLPLVWLPWEAGLQEVDVTLGDMTDREADHGGERGILFAPAKDSSERLEVPRCYVPMIEADPIFYVSPTETERMQRLARERLPSVP